MVDGALLRAAAGHRFEAARNCGHQTIRAEVYDSLSDDEAELIQIDENLIRANLSDAERILHVARRKELYEKLHPETKHGGDRRSAGARSSSQNENLKAFGRHRRKDRQRAEHRRPRCNSRQEGGPSSTTRGGPPSPRSAMYCTRAARWLPMRD